jgi:hypothetical protein
MRFQCLSFLTVGTGTITLKDGGAEKTTYTFQSIGLVPDANGVIKNKNNGTAFFHTSSTNDKLASINNLSYLA